MTSGKRSCIMSAGSSTRRPFVPDEWTDPKRAKYLMADFRARAANPEGYEAKMAFWKRNIAAWSSSNQIISFTVADVRQAFARDGVLPDAACIRRVLSEMLADEEIRPRSELERMLSERLAVNSWSSSWSRGVGLISKPLYWGWNYLTSSYTSEEDSGADRIQNDETFVKMSSLSEAAERLFRELTTTTAGNEKQIWKYAEVGQTSAASGITKSDMQLLLFYLQSEKKACVIDDCGTRLVKFGDAAAFSQLEVGLFRLESAKELLEKDVRQIELEMSSLKEEARQAVNNNNRSHATQLLRRKKRLEHLLVNKESQLDNIHVLLQQMSDSDSNVMILNSFQQAADVLKQVQSVDTDVDQTMLDVEEVVQSAASLQSDLSRAIDPDVDEGLEQELREILHAEQDHAPGPKTDDVDDLLSRLQRLRTPESANPQPLLAAVPRRPKAAVPVPSPQF